MTFPRRASESPTLWCRWLIRGEARRRKADEEGLKFLAICPAPPAAGLYVSSSPENKKGCVRYARLPIDLDRSEAAFSKALWRQIWNIAVAALYYLRDALWSRRGIKPVLSGCSRPCLGLHDDRGLAADARGGNVGIIPTSSNQPSMPGHQRIGGHRSRRFRTQAFNLQTPTLRIREAYAPLSRSTRLSCFKYSIASSG